MGVIKQSWQNKKLKTDAKKSHGLSLPILEESTKKLQKALRICGIILFIDCIGASYLNSLLRWIDRSISLPSWSLFVFSMILPCMLSCTIFILSIILLRQKDGYLAILPGDIGLSMFFGFYIAMNVFILYELVLKDIVSCSPFGLFIAPLSIYIVLFFLLLFPFLFWQVLHRIYKKHLPPPADSMPQTSDNTENTRAVPQ